MKRLAKYKMAKLLPHAGGFKIGHRCRLQCETHNLSQPLINASLKTILKRNGIQNFPKQKKCTIYYYSPCDTPLTLWTLNFTNSWEQILNVKILEEIINLYWNVFPKKLTVLLSCVYFQVPMPLWYSSKKANTFFPPWSCLRPCLRQARDLC
jgi:hypothetical protein